MLHHMNAKRIVVKVGSSTLTHSTGKLNLRRIDQLAKTLSDLMNAGREVVLVSSGAIAVGRAKMNLPYHGATTAEKQAAAAIGQCELMDIYDRAFGNYGRTTAQVLLTKDVLDNEHSKQNAVNTFEQLLSMGVIPIVNENDTISFEEIEFGDNDTLSAMVAAMIHAQSLVLLTDIDGLYNKNPAEPDAQLIPVVFRIDDELRAVAGGSGSKVGTGGMITKLNAAEIATKAGIAMSIANGKSPELLYDIYEGHSVGTLFLPQEQSF